MQQLILPTGYRPLLDAKRTERAILRIKDAFQTSFAYELNLVRVTAPLLVRAGTGINDRRAPDYDDWSTTSGEGRSGLNGDIIVHKRVLDSAFDRSSMGIRVDAAALRRQLSIRGCEERAELYFHKRLLAGEQPGERDTAAVSARI